MLDLDTCLKGIAHQASVISQSVDGDTLHAAHTAITRIRTHLATALKHPIDGAEHPREAWLVLKLAEDTERTLGDLHTACLALDAAAKYARITQQEQSKA
jgi:hypothetical protein